MYKNYKKKVNKMHLLRLWEVIIYRSVMKIDLINTAWKVSKYGIISGLHYLVFGLNTGKYEPKTTLYLDTFHAV